MPYTFPSTNKSRSWWRVVRAHRIEIQWMLSNASRSIQHAFMFSVQFKICQSSIHCSQLCSKLNSFTFAVFIVAVRMKSSSRWFCCSFPMHTPPVPVYFIIKRAFGGGSCRMWKYLVVLTAKKLLQNSFQACYLLLLASLSMLPTLRPNFTGK